MHNGDDAAFYLGCGYSVVAVEANPVLVELARTRFASQIAEGSVQLLNVGISDVATRTAFWVNEQNDEWSSFSREIGCRDGTPCRAIDVECMPIGPIIERFGVPHYMKIDIEGHDLHCLQGLTQSTAPRYLSVEAHRLEYLLRLYDLGYRSFKCIDQSDHNWPGRPTRIRVVDALRRRTSRRIRRVWQSRPMFPHGSSGPFGEETRGPWEDLETVAYKWLRRQRGKGPLNPHGWYDFHARKD